MVGDNLPTVDTGDVGGALSVIYKLAVPRRLVHSFKKGWVFLVA